MVLFVLFVLFCFVHITLGYPWYPLSEVELALADFWMNFQDFASMLVPDITHLTIKVTPMQIYAYVCGAGVYACVFNPAPHPWRAASSVELADLGQRSLSKIYLGGPPLPPTQPISRSLFRSFFDPLLSLVI